MFHTGNAYDAADGTVVMDVVRYESMFHTNSLSAFDDNGDRITVGPVASGRDHRRGATGGVNSCASRLGALRNFGPMAPVRIGI